MKKRDEIFKWQGFANGFGKWESKCRLRLYEHEGLDVVVATEIPENEGTSITNCAENLMGLVSAEFDMDMQKMVWIEHYPAKFKVSPDGRSEFEEREETYDLTLVDLLIKQHPMNPKLSLAYAKSPRWKRIAKAHAESLCGEEL